MIKNRVLSNPQSRSEVAKTITDGFSVDAPKARAIFKPENSSENPHQIVNSQIISIASQGIHSSPFTVSLDQLNQDIEEDYYDQ